MEEYNFSFRAGVAALQDLSANAVASQLWQLPDIKRQVESFLDEYHPCWREKAYHKLAVTYLDKLSPEISEIVKQELNHSYLPGNVKILIENKVLEMLEPAFNWIMYLIQDLNIDCKYVGKIYWTSNGTIDVDKIFQSLWMDFSEDNSFEAEKFDRNVKPFCYFVQEAFINNFKTNIANEIELKLPLELRYNCDIVFQIMKAVINYYDVYPIWILWTDERYVFPKPAVRMLEICMSLCLHKAFVYFWNRIDEIEKFNYLENQSTSCFPLEINVEVEYGLEYLFQIAVFLMNEMNVSQRDNFILCNFQLILLMSLKKKPLRMLCKPLLDKYLSRLDDRIDLLVSVSNFRSYPQTNEKLHLEILQFLMERSSIHDKEFAFLDRKLALIGVLNNFQIPVVKLIFNDTYLRTCRFDMIHCVIKKCRYLVRNNGIFELLNTFIDEISISESQALYLKEAAEDNVEYCISFGCFGALDNVLDWMRALNHDQKLLIILTFDWTSLSTNRKSLGLDKLIKWYFDAQEEPFIKNCEDESLIKRLCCKLIYESWLRSTLFGHDLAIEISTKVLISVFGSDEEILNFKRNELANEDFVKSLCEEKIRSLGLNQSETSFSVADEFFNFCSLPLEKVEDLKKLISDNINYWIMKYGHGDYTGFGRNRFDIVVPLLDWVYGNKIDNRDKLLSIFEDHSEVISYYKNRKL